MRTHALSHIVSFIAVAVAVAVIAHISSPPASAAPLPADAPVRGWTILSDSEPDAQAVIAAAKDYQINHLQLSHHLVHDLREIKDDKKLGLVNRLTDAAHAAGVTEVVLWDHALYGLDYYPKEFRTGPKETIDLDNEKFWEWLKADYRKMLDRVPNADGIVLTFIETGARAERQHSTRLKTNQEKLAAVVDAVADVVCGERKLNLYARTFAYNYAEYDNIIGAVKLFRRPEVRLMMKETPHDFFLTHPNDRYAGTIDRPTLIEFDAAGEFNGQGIIAITWPQYILGRWRNLQRRPNVVGYTARTDRYGNTRLIGTPNEVNLFALKRATEDREMTAEAITDEFITSRYGAAALPELKAAFANAFDIVTSTLYTLGTNTANHSALDYDPYRSHYVLHVSGKWLDPPVVRLGHGVDRELHYWRDVIDRIAPPFVKSPKNRSQWNEVPEVISSGWIHEDERMDEEFLRHIITERDHGVALAEESLAHVSKAKPALQGADHDQLHRLFERTLLTARLHRAVAGAYFGFRVWSRGGEHRSEYVTTATRDSLAKIPELAKLIRAHPTPPRGQWNWTRDADNAERYFKQITQGWPAQTRGIENPYGEMRFPVESK
jgi:hypothetical protein